MVAIKKVFKAVFKRCWGCTLFMSIAIHRLVLHKIGNPVSPRNSLHNA